MTEFSLINRFCRDIGASHPQTSLSVGDDAALVQIPATKELAISVDTMVESVHFLPHIDPATLAKKLLAVNLSDMAAMGAEAKWATLALTLPSVDEAWLANFSNALDDMAKSYGVQLIGGDTTQGPLTLSLQIMGLVDKGRALRRGGCALGDDVYVSGCVGDAALALASILGQESLADGEFEQIESAFHCPIPQCTLGRSLIGLAASCIDLSDGLLGDLQHIASTSDVSISINLENLPLSDTYRRYLKAGGKLDYAICGGEDYQLAFTANQNNRQQIEQLTSQLGIQVTRIGVAQQRGEIGVITKMNGKPYPVKATGYQHFN